MKNLPCNHLVVFAADTIILLDTAKLTYESHLPASTYARVKLIARIAELTGAELRQAEQVLIHAQETGMSWQPLVGCTEAAYYDLDDNIQYFTVPA